MITNEQVEAALKAWYDAGDAGNFASMFAALKAADLEAAARIAELTAALKPFADRYAYTQKYCPDREHMPIGLEDLRAADAAYREMRND